MKCHTVGVHLELLTYLIQTLFNEGGETPIYVIKYFRLSQQPEPNRVWLRGGIFMGQLIYTILI